MASNVQANYSVLTPIEDIGYDAIMAVKCSLVTGLCGIAFLIGLNAFSNGLLSNIASPETAAIPKGEGKPPIIGQGKPPIVTQDKPPIHLPPIPEPEPEPVKEPEPEPAKEPENENKGATVNSAEPKTENKGETENKPHVKPRKNYYPHNAKTDTNQNEARNNIKEGMKRKRKNNGAKT